MGGAGDKKVLQQQAAAEERRAAAESARLTDYYTTKPTGYGYHGQSVEEIEAWAAKEGNAYQGGGKEKWLAEQGFQKKYAEDPAFRKMTNDNRESNFFNRVGDAAGNVGKGLERTVKDIGPIAAVMGGGALATANLMGGAGATALNTGTAAGAGGTGVANAIAPAAAFNPASTAPQLMGGGAAGNAFAPAVTSAGYTGTGAAVTGDALSGAGSMSPNAMAPIDGIGPATNALIGPATNALTSGAPPWLDNALIAGGSLASGLLSYNATENGIDEISRQYDQTRADMEPWRQAGVRGLGNYEDRLDQPVDQFQFNLEDDPIYQFQRDEALKATDRAMSARGYNESGNVLRELQRTAIGEAGRYQGDAYNRQLGTSQTNYGREFDRTNQYGNLAGLGQSTTNALANVGQNSANSIAGLNVQQGAGLNNAIQGGITNYLVNDRSKNNPWNPYQQPWKEYA